MNLDPTSAAFIRYHRQVRRAVDVGIAILLGLAVLSGLLYLWLRGLQPRLDGNLRVPGLHGPVDIARDTRGIPHIQAQDIHDAYFAEGYAMAQDRLWQMDLLRRTGEGRLAEIFGTPALPLDVAARTLGLGRTAAAEAGRLPPDEAALLDAFTAGVNMYIVTRGWRLPLEFRLLRYHPELWRDQDTLALVAYMYLELASDYKYKIEREAFQAALGPDVTAQIFPSRSPWDVIPGAPPPFAPGVPPASQLVGGVAAALALPVFSVAADQDFAGAGAALADPAGGGSNAWVVAGTRSFNGRPILANDPHLAYSVPSVWWAVELTAAGLHVEGAALVGAPGIVIGHNDTVGWGLTAANADVQDLYRETVEHDRVLTHTGWQPLQHWSERIHVRGGPDVTMSVPVTEHGPVVGHDAGGALALRWSLYTPGALQSARCLLAIEQAHDWASMERALAGFPGPALNFMYADTSGHIGYQLAGWVPKRPPGIDGSLPLPGAAGIGEWQGWIPFAQLPHAEDPPAGVLVTANGRVTPDNAPYVISTVWDAPNRTRRIYQLLGMLHVWNASAMSTLQMDVVSEQDRNFAEALVEAADAETAAGRPPSDAAREAVGMLRGFRGVMGRASMAPTLAVETRGELVFRLLEARVGPALARRYDWDESPVWVQSLLANRPADWLPPSERNLGWNHLLMDCLASVAARHTLDSADLHWGRYEPLLVEHPLYSHIPVLRDFADLGPVEISGSPLTVKQARNVLLGDDVDLGPSLRAVYNFADWDRSTLTLFSGESGQLFNPHYRDEFSAYLRGQALPLWFTAPAVAAHRRHDLRLHP